MGSGGEGGGGHGRPGGAATRGGWAVAVKDEESVLNVPRTTFVIEAPCMQC